MCFSPDILNWPSPDRRPCECGSGHADAREHACGTRGRARSREAALRLAGVHHAGWLQEDPGRRWILSGYRLGVEIVEKLRVDKEE